jgi:hypothetical protein
MSELAHTKAGAKPAKPAWRQASGWSAWLAITYGGALLVARAIVTYRLGGQFMTPYFGVLIGSALITAAALWPLLAYAAREPVRAFYIQAGIQWGTIGLLAVALVTVLGSTWEDTNLETLARLVARDVVVARANQQHSQGEVR